MNNKASLGPSVFTPKWSKTAPKHLQALKTISTEDIKVNNILKTNSDGAVQLVTIAGVHGTFVLKLYAKAGLKPKMSVMVRREIQITSQLKHPNVLGLLGFWDSPQYISLLFEHCTERDLYTQIHDRDDETDVEEAFGEAQSQAVARQLLQALDYLHNKCQVIHRDIKTENVFVTKAEASDKLIYKLADFNFAVDCSQERPTSALGTKNFLSPEMLKLQRDAFKAKSMNGQLTDKGLYSFEVDIWSFGVVIYECLTNGYYPFPEYHSNDLLLTHMIQDGPIWRDGISPKAKDFLSRCLEPNGDLRATTQELLQHPWVISPIGRTKKGPSAKRLGVGRDKSRTKMGAGDAGAEAPAPVAAGTSAKGAVSKASSTGWTLPNAATTAKDVPESSSMRPDPPPRAHRSRSLQELDPRTALEMEAFQQEHPPSLRPVRGTATTPEASTSTAPPKQAPSARAPPPRQGLGLFRRFFGALSFRGRAQVSQVPAADVAATSDPSGRRAAGPGAVTRTANRLDHASSLTPESVGAGKGGDDDRVSFDRKSPRTGSEKGGGSGVRGFGRLRLRMFRRHESAREMQVLPPSKGGAKAGGGNDQSGALNGRWSLAVAPVAEEAEEAPSDEKVRIFATSPGQLVSA